MGTEPAVTAAAIEAASPQAEAAVAGELAAAVLAIRAWGAARASAQPNQAKTRI